MKNICSGFYKILGHTVKNEKAAEDNKYYDQFLFPAIVDFFALTNFKYLSTLHTFSLYRNCYIIYTSSESKFSNKKYSSNLLNLY